MNRLSRLALAAAFVALPAAAQAQVTGQIAASADIATVFAFGTSTALNFGTILPGAAASGSGSIAFQRNVGVVYTLPDGANTGRLTFGTVNLIPSYTCGIGATAATITTSFSSCTPATATTAVATLAAPGSTTTEYVIFNGTLTASQTNVAPGTYTGTIRITATPN